MPIQNVSQHIDTKEKKPDKAIHAFPLKITLIRIQMAHKMAHRI